MVVLLVDVVVVVVVEGEEEKEEGEEGEVEEEQVVGEGGGEAVAVDEWVVEEVGEVDEDEMTVVAEGEERSTLAHAIPRTMHQFLLNLRLSIE